MISLIFRFILFTGTYIRTYVENYGSFLKKIGVGNFLRRNAILSSIETNGVTKKIYVSDGVWKFTTTTGANSSEMEFRIGIPFLQTLNGTRYKTTVTLDRSIMKSDCKAIQFGKKSFHIIRKFSFNGFESTIICDDIVCKEFFKRQ